MTQEAYRRFCADAGIDYTDARYWQYVNAQRRLIGKPSLEDLAQQLSEAMSTAGVSMNQAAAAMRTLSHLTSSADVLQTLRRLNEVFAGRLDGN